MERTTTQHVESAKREMRNMAGFLRRKGITGWVKDRSAAPYYERVLRHLVAVEDAEGVDATASLSQRFQKLTWEARDKGLLTPMEMYAVEKRVLSNG